MGLSTAIAAVDFGPRDRFAASVGRLVGDFDKMSLYDFAQDAFDLGERPATNFLRGEMVDFWKRNAKGMAIATRGAVGVRGNVPCLQRGQNEDQA